MSALGIMMPILAAGSLTIALLVPLRDGRRGDRATLRGKAPVRPAFGTNERGGHKHVNADGAARWFRFIDATTERFALILRLRRRTPESLDARDVDMRKNRDLASNPSFADHIASLIVEPLRADVDSLYEVEIATAERDPDSACDIDRDGCAAAASVEVCVSFEPDDRTSTPVEHTSHLAGSVESGSILSRDIPPPLTRLRLRPGSGAITWPMQLPIPHVGTSEGERREILAELSRTADRSHESVLVSAYREEDAAGRMLALQGLSRMTTAASHSILEEALQLGSDDERALAVDLLSRNDDREALVPALQDRLDAIAARAALAYVRSNRRSDFERLLSPRMDVARIATILALLGGILE